MRVVFCGAVFLSALIACFAGASATSINFGSDVDKRDITLGPGDMGIFEFMLINTGSDRIVVDIEASDSGPIKVSVVPSEVVLDNEVSSADKWYLLDDGVTHVPVFYAKVYAEAPQKIAPTDFHEHFVRVRVMASKDGTSSGDGIKENLVQVHDYELTVRLSDEFYSKLEAPDEKIELSFDRENTVRTVEKDEPEKSNVEYVNVSVAEKIDLTGRVSGKVLEVEKKDDSNGTLIVMIVCILAVGLAVLA